MPSCWQSLVHTERIESHTFNSPYMKDNSRREINGFPTKQALDATPDANTWDSVCLSSEKCWDVLWCVVREDNLPRPARSGHRHPRHANPGAEFHHPLTLQQARVRQTKFFSVASGFEPDVRQAWHHGTHVQRKTAVAHSKNTAEHSSRSRASLRVQR